MAARQGLAAAVIIQPAAAQAGVVQRPELVQKRCRQCRAGTGGGGRIKQRTRHRGKLLGPAAGRLNQVETKPQHGIIQHAGFQVYGGFGQNTADLFAVLPQVVHPFDLDGCAAQLLRCTGSGNCGQCSDLRGLAGAECRPQQNAQVQPARRGEEAVPAPPAPSGLGLGNQHKALRRAVGGLGAQRRIGAGQAVHHSDLYRLRNGRGQQRCDGVRVQQVCPVGQSIAAVGNGFNGGAVRTQGSDGFPDGGPADAELVGKFLPGDIPPARCVQRAEDLCFD